MIGSPLIYLPIILTFIQFTAPTQAMRRSNDPTPLSIK